ncbi:hypothetical protein, partial [Acinetobacter baumannii]|uniref:hypothetical protein n=1 Tax=Acinetobacter baumannii TaxID=470 RepID=UPI001C06E547
MSNLDYSFAHMETTDSTDLRVTQSMFKVEMTTVSAGGTLSELFTTHRMSSYYYFFFYFFFFCLHTGIRATQEGKVLS